MKKVFISAVLSVSMLFGASSVYGLGYNKPIENQVFLDNLESYKEKTVTVYLRDITGYTVAVGTGWILKGGFVVTNDHVANREDFAISEVLVGFYNPERLKSEVMSVVSVVASDSVKDIALLQIKDKELVESEASTYFEVSHGRPISGDPLLSLANLPDSAQPYYDTSEGTFKRDEAIRWNIRGGMQITENMYTLDLESRPGNSGGPIIDKYGRIVGMMRGYKDGSSHMEALAVTLEHLNEFLSRTYSAEPVKVLSVEVVKEGAKSANGK